MARSLLNGSGYQICNYGACLNPALALGISVAAVIENGSRSLSFLWIFAVMPVLGALAGVVCVELVHKKTFQMIKAEKSSEDTTIYSNSERKYALSDSITE